MLPSGDRSFNSNARKRISFVADAVNNERNSITHRPREHILRRLQRAISIQRSRDLWTQNKRIFILRPQADECWYWLRIRIDGTHLYRPRTCRAIAIAFIAKELTILGYSLDYTRYDFDTVECEQFLTSLTLISFATEDPKTSKRVNAHNHLTKMSFLMSISAVLLSQRSYAVVRIVYFLQLCYTVFTVFTASLLGSRQNCRCCDRRGAPR